MEKIMARIDRLRAALNEIKTVADCLQLGSLNSVDSKRAGREISLIVQSAHLDLDGVEDEIFLRAKPECTASVA